jgi:hypothetical protein
MSTIAQESTLFEIDRELDMLLDEIQEHAQTDGTDEVAPELIQRFQEFCQAHGEKVDRIGHFLALMESRALYCRAQAARLSERARSAENKTERTKSMILYYLQSRNLRKIEGPEFTLRMQKNSQDSVLIRDETQVPIEFREYEAKIPGRLWHALQSGVSVEDRRELNACIRQMKPNAEAIKLAMTAQEEVPGAELRRGFHLRVV